MKRVVLITGATSGIGLETALLFKQNGDITFITSRNPEKVRNVTEKYGFDDGFVLDVRNYENWIEIKNLILQKYGKIDILVNNAGCGGIIDTVNHQTKQSIDMVVDTNFKGVVYGCNVFAPCMIEKEDGMIINVASIAARQQWENWALYCAAKAGVLSFSKSMHLELRKYKIRVTAILPGGVTTGFQKSCNIDEEEETMTAEDVASTILYCSNLNKDIAVEELTIRGIID